MAVAGVSELEDGVVDLVDVASVVGELAMLEDAVSRAVTTVIFDREIVVGRSVVSAVRPVIGMFVGRRLVRGRLVGRRSVRGRPVGRRSGIRSAMLESLW